jgi:probable rRNA maturation factor
MTVTLDWANEQEQLEISPTMVDMFRRLLEEAARMEEVEGGEVALTFVDNETIHSLNREYRGIDRPTDVLSFAMREMGEDEPEILSDDIPDMLGDIVISVPRAIEQAQEYGHSVERELGFLFVHGFLHLIGYDHDHEEAEKEMFRRQESILQAVGLHR